MVKRDINAFRERFSRWKNGELVYDKGRPITEYLTGKDEGDATAPVLSVKAGDKVDTHHCAEWLNRWLRENGYLIYGDAWNLKNVDMLYSGYKGMKKPKKYDLDAIEQYNHAAADSINKNFKSDKMLDRSKPYVVNMFYNGSPKQKDAYDAGDNVTGTHTGVLMFDPWRQAWMVTHNIHGTIYQDSFFGLQHGVTDKGKYGVTAIYEPRKNTAWNKVRGMFGFEGGKDESADGSDIPFGDQWLKQVTVTALKPLWMRKQEYLLHPELWPTTSEILPNGRVRGIGMSGADPIGELVVSNAVLNPAFKLIGKAALYGLGKAGNNWARAKLISGALNKSSIGSKATAPVADVTNLQQPVIASIAEGAPHYQQKYDLGHLIKRYVNQDGTFKDIHIPQTITENTRNNSHEIDLSSVIKQREDKRFMMFEPGKFINYDIGGMSTEDIISTFGPEAEHYKKLYDIAKSHNFEGKFAKIGKDAQYQILNRFAINKSDLDVARGIELARKIYSIPEYRKRFDRWGDLGDTFVEDALARIDNVKLLGISKNLKITGLHGVNGGAYTARDASLIGVKNTDSRDILYNMVRHEMNHVGHGLLKLPKWMELHNEKIRPIVRPEKSSTDIIGKYLDEMDEIVERSKTAVLYANEIRNNGETLGDALTRLADIADNNIYDLSIPSDIRQMMSRFTKESTLNFWKNFVGGFAVPTAFGTALTADYKNGKDSGIHIKPSHRGRLTALKKRTGKSEAELYRTGGPAVRKMITFARSSRKWHKK